MAAALSIAATFPHRSISSRKLEANRRNAKRSSGPRTPEGKARVARNAVKHGFFAGIERWSDEDRSALDEIVEGLRDEFKPTDAGEDHCVATMATATVRLAMAWRYEAVAAQEYHLRSERDLNEHIANASSLEAVRLEAHRETLKAAGLWCPILPDERTMRAIARFEGSLDRMRTRAYSTLICLQKAKAAVLPMRTNLENAKTNPPRASQTEVPRPSEGSRIPPKTITKNEKTKPLRDSVERCLSASRRTSTAIDLEREIAKTNPPRNRETMVFRR